MNGGEHSAETPTLKNLHNAIVNNNMEMVKKLVKDVQDRGREVW